MSWAPAARTATAAVKLGQQQQQRQQQSSVQQKQRQQHFQKRQLPHQEASTQREQFQPQQPQQLRPQRPQRTLLSRASVRRASVQIQEILGERRRRSPNNCSRGVKNGILDDAVPWRHFPSASRSCNTHGSNVQGEGTGKRGTQPGSAIVASQMFKTKLCIDHQTRGCTRGDSCPYAHSVEEMRNLPDLRKTKMCSLVLAGKGCKNRACKFAHSEEELRYTCTFSEFKTRICRFAQERGGRGCLYGVRCPYAHSPSELRPLEGSTVSPTDASHLKEKANAQDEVVPCDRRLAGSNATPSSLHDLQGKHGIWGPQRDPHLDQETTHQQEDDNRQTQKEHSKQHQQHQRWQKSQQQRQASPQQELRAQPKQWHQQQPEAHHQKKPARTQPRQCLKPHQLRKNNACEGWGTSVKSVSEPLKHAENKREEDEEYPLEKAASSCAFDYHRRMHNGAAFQFAAQKDSSQLLVGCDGSPKRDESFAVAKLPRSLNKGARATSAIVEAHEAEFCSPNDGRAKEGKRILSAELLHHDQDPHHLGERHTREKQRQGQQYQQTEDQQQSSASAQQYIRQHGWDSQAAEEDVTESHTPELLPGQGPFLTICEPSQQRYLSIADSPLASSAQQLAASLSPIEEEGSLRDPPALGSSYDDNGSDVVGDNRWDCKYGFASVTGPASPVTSTDTPSNETLRSWLDHSSSNCKRYNGSVAVLPPPGFEHVRIKPVSDFAYTDAAPWLSGPSATDPNNAEECLLLHLHRQLLLHCQRQSDVDLLPSAAISRTPPTSNAPTVVKKSSAASFLEGVAGTVWEDAFLTAAPNPNR